MSLEGWKSFVYDCTARNNEEYKAELKKRMRTMTVLFVLGALTLATMIVLILLKPEMLESYEAGLFTGMGTGLMVGAVFGILRLRSRMKNDDTLKKARLAETDERERDISNKAIRVTSKIVLLAFYLVMLCSLFFSKVLAFVMCGFILLYFVSYVVCRNILSKRM